MKDRTHNNQAPTHRWFVYIALLLLRFIGVVQRGYVHPDEFYQGGSELFFGRQHQRLDSDGSIRIFHDNNNDGQQDGTIGADYLVTNVPWEFEPSNAVRSIVPPLFMTLLPLRVYVSLHSLLGGSIAVTEVGSTSTQKSWVESSMLWTPAMSSLSGYEILVIPRLFMAMLSVLFLDGSLWMLISDDYSMPPMEVIALASSWPCLVFGVRPFTNNLEAMVLAFLLVVAVRCVNRRNNKQKGSVSSSVPSLLIIGATCSIGIFVRFTFAFFAFPVLMIFLWHRSKGKLIRIMQDGLCMALSFVIVSCAFIWADTQYYSWQAILTCDNPHCEETSTANMNTFLKYIAPFNAFRYNSKSTNLAEHGLHPRITHAGEFMNTVLLASIFWSLSFTHLFLLSFQL